MAQGLQQRAAFLEDAVDDLEKLLNMIRDSVYDMTELSHDVIDQASNPDEYEEGYASNEFMDQELAQAEGCNDEIIDALRTMQETINQMLKS
jgi:hypothetical protein